MKSKLLLFFLLLPLLTSCVNSKVIDDLTLVTAAGIDFKDDQIEFITIAPKFLPEKQMMDLHQIITVPAHTDLLNSLDRQSSRPVLLGDMDVFVIGKKFASKGVFPIIDTLQRNPNIGSRLYLVIAEDPLYETMTGEYGTNGNAIYLTNLLDHNIKLRDLPKTNIHLFAADFFQEDLDAFLPILKIVNKDVDDEKLEISGIGIFHDSKLAYTLPADKLFTFKFLVDNHTNGSISVPLGKQHAVVSSIQSKMKLKVDLKNEKVKVTFKSKGIVESYTGKKVDHKTIKKIKDAFNKQLEKDTLRILTTFQELSIDPVGIQRKFRQQHRNFNKSEWDDLYKNLTFEVSSDSELVESGTIE